MSSIKFMHETTSNWKTNFNMPNHIYILEGSTCLGYIAQGTESEIWFANSLKNFDKRGRTFDHLKTRKDVNAVLDGWL